VFVQEILESSTAEGAGLPAQQPHPSQVLKLFWDRQAAVAPGSSTATAPTVTSMNPTTVSLTAAGLHSVSAGMRPGSGAAGAAATGAAAHLGQQPQFAAAAAAVSRYRSDFQEINRLGQGGFGVVVAAVNRQVAGIVFMVCSISSNMECMLHGLGLVQLCLVLHGC
jgi:hypothetical protein